MVVVQRGECEKAENLRKENESAEKFVVQKLLRAFDDDAVKDNFKDLVVYFKKHLYADGKDFCSDILLWKEDVGVIFVEVKAWDRDFIEREGWEQLTRKRGNPLSQVKMYINLVLSSGIKPVSGVLAFPNLSVKDVETLSDASARNFFTSLRERILFKEDFLENELLRKKVLKGVYDFYESIPLEEIKANMLKFRKLFFPELEVPFKSSVLDYLQEEASYYLTRPPKNVGLKIKDCNVVSGCAGTGKSVVVQSATVRKALEYYYSGERHRKIQVLVYNRTFREKMYRDILYTINQRKLPKEILKMIDVSTIHFIATKILNLNRINFKVSKEEDAVKIAVEFLNKGKLRIPEEFKPDVLLVDEAQDIKRDWFTFIHALVKPDTIIGFAIDKVQRIYEGTEWKTWSEVGFNAKGRSKVLKRIYRSASDIFLLGLEFLKLDREYFRELSKLEGSWIGQELETVKGKGTIRFLGEDKDFQKTLKLLKHLLAKYKPEDLMVVSFFSSKVSNLKSVIGRDKTLSEFKELQ